MGWRSRINDYSRAGYYHITIKVSRERWWPLGRVIGNVAVPDGGEDAPRVDLSAVGRMVEEELLGSIPKYYPMVEVQDYVIMPEHLHFILYARRPIVSQNGRSTHLGQAIAGFKKGCNRRFWEMTGQRGEDGQRGEEGQRGEDGQRGKPSAAEGMAKGGMVSPSAVFPQKYKVPSQASTGRQPLFALGYVDVMPLKEGQLDKQREYIHNNPRSRLMRSQQRSVLQAQRGGIDTALPLAGLKRYLQRECKPHQITEEIWARLLGRLLVTGKGMATGKAMPAEGGKEMASGKPMPAEGEKGMATGKAMPAEGEKGMASGKPMSAEGAQAGLGVAVPFVAVDSYGDRGLLGRRLLPVVCHNRDRALFEWQKRRCIEEAQRGAVLVSARIAKGEQEIIDAAVQAGYAVIVVEDNGFPDVYHPSAARIERCADGRLLIVTPWRFAYRRVGEAITVAECKVMNCVAQALCRKADNWWRSEV